MPEIAWHLLQPVDTGAQVMQGFQTGMALVKGIQTRSALSHYLQNPDDPQALSALAYLDPQQAGEAQRQRLIQLKTQQEQQDRERATALGELAATDPAGAREEALRAGDLDLAKSFGELDQDQQKKAAAFWETAGPVAFRLKQIADPEQRRALYEQAKPILAATGANPQLIEQFDPTNDVQLDAAITTAQKIGDLIDQGKITWHQQGEQPSFATDFMGRPVGSQNPYAQGGSAPAPSSGDTSAPRGIRNNNPLNLTKSEFTTAQPGYAGTDDGGRYARFESPEAGIAAAQNLLGSYLQRGFDTPRDIINRWAPAGENGAASTANYASFVSQRLGISPGDKVGPQQIPTLIQAMSDWENGHHSGPVKVASAGGVPHVASKSEFDNLPSGTVFIAPDGSRRRKP